MSTLANRRIRRRILSHRKRLSNVETDMCHVIRTMPNGCSCVKTVGEQPDCGSADSTEHFFIEKVPEVGKADEVYWKQGNFPFGSEQRIATVTDVKFVSNERAVVAHRAAAKLFLVSISDKKCTVLDSIVLKVNGRVYHPDSMSVCHNVVFVVHYDDTCCMLRVIDGKFVFMKTFVIKKNIPYHGIFSTDSSVYFGGVRSGDNNTFVTIYEKNKFGVDWNGDFEANPIEMKLGFNRRVKSLARYNDDLVLVCDGKTQSQRVFDSYIMLYRLNPTEMTFLNEVVLENSQTDGLVMQGNNFFATIHSADDRCGYIVVGEILDDTVRVLRKVKCASFPHGIDICNDKLAYSSYTNSSIILHYLNDFMLS